MKILSGALLVVLALSVVLVASASAATVGGGTAATMPHPDEFSQLFAACLDTRDANSDECYRAQEASGLSPEEFFDKRINHNRNVGIRLGPLAKNMLRTQARAPVNERHL